MMELEHKSSSSFASDMASTSGFSGQLAMINAEQLASILSNSDGYDIIVLDCRPAGALPKVRSAHHIFLPSVLQRRLNNGTISPTSISPLLCETDRRVIILPDSLSPNSVASRIFNTLARRQFTVACFNEDVQRLANISPELCSESVGMNGLNLNILSVCDALGKKVASQTGMRVHFDNETDENRHRRPNALFPVQILPYLYLGNDETAKNKDTLDRFNIRYVINVTNNLPNYFKDDCDVNYLRIGVDDTCSHNLIEHFPTAIAFIERAREAKAAVLVHCWAGISRSVTICLAYLMQATHSTLEQAFDFLLKQNGAIAPNFHFMGQLIEFERNLFDTTASSTSTSSLPSSTTSAVSIESSACSSA